MKTLVAILLAALVQATIAQSPVPGSVQGIIVSSEGSLPVMGGIVELRDIGQDGAPRAVTVSNNKGEFLFSNVVPGRFRIVVTRNGFASRQGPLIMVAPGQKVSLAPLTLFLGASVSGRITYPNGNPMPIAGVSVVKAGYGDDGHIEFSEVASQITNDQGEFRFFWLPPGTFYLKAVNNRNNMQTVIVLNPNGNGARTAAGMMGGGRNTPPTTSDPGLKEDQTFTGLYFPGTSDWQQATPLELRPGSELRNVNMSMKAETQVRVRGVAYSQSTSQPAQGTVIASIRSIDPASGELGSYLSYLQFPQGSGVFEFRGVFSGRYEIRASADGLSGRAIIDVRGVDADTRVPLFPPVTLAGRIKSEGPPVDLSSIHIGITGDGVAVATNGEFLIPNVAIGVYTLTTKFPPTMPDGYVQSIRFQDADITNSPLIVEGGSASPIDVVINSAGASVDGTAVNSRGEAAPGAVVLLIPDQVGAIRPGLYRNTTADGSGKFEFHALPPGGYVIYAWTDVEKNSWFAPSFLRDFESYRQPVKIGLGQKLQIRVTAAQAN